MASHQPVCGIFLYGTMKAAINKWRDGSRTSHRALSPEEEFEADELSTDCVVKRKKLQNTL